MVSSTIIYVRTKFHEDRSRRSKFIVGGIYTGTQIRRQRVDKKLKLNSKISKLKMTIYSWLGYLGLLFLTDKYRHSPRSVSCCVITIYTVLIL
jgi:hypothetical protein